MKRVSLIELVAGGVSIGLGLIGYFIGCSPLELLGVVGAVFAFGLLVARVLLTD